MRPRVPCNGRGITIDTVSGQLELVPMQEYPIGWYDNDAGVPEDYTVGFGVYFCDDDDGHLFFDVKGDDVHFYSARHQPGIYWAESRINMAVPIILTSYRGELPPGDEKDIISKRVKEIRRAQFNFSTFSWS